MVKELQKSGLMTRFPSTGPLCPLSKRELRILRSARGNNYWSSYKLC